MPWSAPLPGMGGRGRKSRDLILSDQVGGWLKLDLIAMLIREPCRCISAVRMRAFAHLLQCSLHLTTPRRAQTSPHHLNPPHTNTYLSQTLPGSLHRRPFRVFVDFLGQIRRAPPRCRSANNRSTRKSTFETTTKTTTKTTTVAKTKAQPFLPGPR